MRVVQDEVVVVHVLDDLNRLLVRVTALLLGLRTATAPLMRPVHSHFPVMAHGEVVHARVVSGALVTLIASQVLPLVLATLSQVLSSLATHVAPVVTITSAQSLHGAAFTRVVLLLLLLVVSALARRLTRRLLLVDDFACVILVVLEGLTLEILGGAFRWLVEVQLGRVLLFLLR